MVWVLCLAIDFSLWFTVDQCLDVDPKNDEIIETHFPVLKDRQGIFGHSMGGHGALTLALKYPDRFRSVSAFAPICAPSQCPWGEKGFSAYLGENREDWKKHDANELMKTSDMKIPMLIDQGSADDFLERELNFKLFEKTCKSRKRNGSNISNSTCVYYS